jgi:hypothetical protein
MATRSISIWTIYDKPRDYPTCYVARRFEASADGVRPTADCIVSPQLEPLREELRDKGLTPLPPAPEDPPHLVESWL